MLPCLKIISGCRVTFLTPRKLCSELYYRYSQYPNVHKQLIAQCIDELDTSVKLEHGLRSFLPPKREESMGLDRERIERLWSELFRLAPKQTVLSPTGQTEHVVGSTVTEQILSMFVDALVVIKREAVILRALWALDLAIEKGYFEPVQVTLILFDRPELKAENADLFRCIFSFLIKQVFYLDYKKNHLVFTKTIDKAFQPIQPYQGRSQYNPAIELMQILLCREMILLPAYCTMFELNRYRLDNNRRNKFPIPTKPIEAEVERFMREFDYPLRILYSYHEFAMVPIAGVTVAGHPSFRLEPPDLTLAMMRQAHLYPAVSKSQQLGLFCDLLGQLHSTRFVISLLVMDERLAIMPNDTPIGLAISELIFSVMQITEREGAKCTAWTLRVFSHLASLVITFIVDRIVRLHDILSKLITKIEGRYWPISRHFVMWFTLVCMSGFVRSNKLTDFVCCLHLFDQLFPEVNELDSETMARLAQMHVDGNDSSPPLPYGRGHQRRRKRWPVTLKTIKAMSGRNSDLRFLLFSPDRLFGDSAHSRTIKEGEEDDETEASETDGEADDLDEVNSSWRDEEGEETSSCDSSSSDGFGTESDDEVQDLIAAKRPRMDNGYHHNHDEPRENGDGGGGGENKKPRRKRRRREDEDLTHIVVASTNAWEIIMQMNHAGGGGFGGGGGGASDEMSAAGGGGFSAAMATECHLPRPLPPLLYPLRTQLAKWLECLNYACAVAPALSNGNGVDSSEEPQEVQALSWLEFIVTLNTYSPSEKLQITRSIVASFWLPDNKRRRGVGGGLPLNNGTFELPYGLKGAGRLNPLPNRLLRKMSIHLQMIFCNEMHQKLIEMTKPQQPQPSEAFGTANLTSPATLETFSRFLQCQVAKNLIHIRQECRRLLQNLVPLNVPLFYEVTEANSSVDGDDDQPLNDDFYALNFWLDLLGHRLVDALHVEHRISYRDELFCRVNLDSHEIIHALDWAVLRFSRRILTPDCVLYNMHFLQSHQLHQQLLLQQQQQLQNPTCLCAHSREVTSRVILLSTLQACCAYDLLEANEPANPAEESMMRALVRRQLATMRAETRAIFGEEVGAPSSRLQLPAVIARFAGLLPLTALQDPFFGTQGHHLPPIFPAPVEAAAAGGSRSATNSSSAGDTEATYWAPRETLILGVQNVYASLMESGEFDWSAVNLQDVRAYCVIVVALMNEKGPVPVSLLNNLLQLSTVIVNAQIKVLCEFLVTQICKHDDLARPNYSLPAHIYMPTKLLSAVLTFCVQYGIITLDRLLLYLFVRSNHSPVDVAAAHGIAVFLITQCPQLVQAIKTVGEFAPKCPKIVSSRRWPILLRRLHDILPEKQLIVLDDGTKLRRRPRQPIYYDHLVLRLVPVLEIIFTSFLDNPPPLLLLARFCEVVAPLFRLHSHPMSLCFLLLRGQFHHFSSGVSGGVGGSSVGRGFAPQVASSGSNAGGAPSGPVAAGTGDTAMISGGGATATTPTTPGHQALFQQVTWRNATQVDRVACQLVLRCILSVHQALAVRENIGRPCAQAFVDPTSEGGGSKDVCGLLSPPAWASLEALHKAALSLIPGGCASALTDTNISECLRWAYGDAAEIRLATSLATAADEAFPVNGADLERHFDKLLSPVVTALSDHGVTGTPAWVSSAAGGGVNIQAAGVQAVAVEMMVLHPPSDTSRVASATSSLLECIRKRSAGNTFHKWLNVTGALVSVLPYVFRHNILCMTCSLINDPVFNDTELWPHTLVTMRIAAESAPQPLPPARLMRIFRRRRRLTTAPATLTFFLETVEAGVVRPEAVTGEPGGDWEVLGRPHASSVRFFETILPATFPRGEAPPNHLFKAAVWHAIWSHANLNENPSLPRRIFDEFILKHLNNEAKLLMAFSMITPSMKALSTGKSVNVDLTVSLYKAVQQVDEILAAAGVPLYHVKTIADLLYHIKYTYVGKAPQVEVQGLLAKMRPQLRVSLKFVFPPPVSSNNRRAGGNELPVFQEREYRAAQWSPTCLEEEFF